MARLDHTSPVIVAYARSLLELADERQLSQQIDDELRGLRELIESNPSFRAFLRDPGISESERANLLRRVLEGRIDPLLMNFLLVVSSKGRLRSIEEIAEAYDDLLDERLGKIEVDVTVAQKLAPDQIEDVRKQVSAALKKDAVIHQYVDESIIGGLILRVQDKLIDASVRAQLEGIRQRLLSPRTR